MRSPTARTSLRAWPTGLPTSDDVVEHVAHAGQQRRALAVRSHRPRRLRAAGAFELVRDRAFVVDLDRAQHVAGCRVAHVERSRRLRLGRLGTFATVGTYLGDG
jgi:hypothetical protein